MARYPAHRDAGSAEESGAEDPLRVFDFYLGRISLPASTSLRCTE